MKRHERSPAIPDTNHGRHGWEPVTAYPLGNNKLVVVLKKEGENDG